MFFSISHSDNLDFSHQWHCHGVTVNTDAGWHQITVGDQYVVYKGYAESGVIPELLSIILEQPHPELLGNFCVIAIGNTISIKTDKYRSFPIWVDQGIEITNLIPLIHPIWADTVVSADLNLTVTEQKFDIIGPIDTSPITEVAALEQLDQILLTRTKNFITHNTLPIKSFLTGGVDSLLVYSYLKRAGIDVDVIEYLHIDYDHFWRANSHHLKKFWGYSQIHHWNTPTVLASGAPGDEFMLRSPVTANMYLRSLGTSIPALLINNPTCLHYDYFMLPKHQKVFEDTSAVPGYGSESIYKLCNILVNDWQHWHIGNTLTWTLLRDIDLIKILVRMPIESTVDQILNSGLSKKLIERNIPGATSWISDQKNSGAMRKNLGRRLETHSGHGGSHA